MRREDAIAVIDEPLDVPARRSGRCFRLLLAAALSAVVAPFAVSAVRVLAGGTAISLAGDEALTGLAVRRAAALSQLLGPYSQWGWNHPGPAWFYLLLPVAELGGGSDRALVAAQLTLHALLAALAVLAAASRTAMWRAPLMAACLLLFVTRMPGDVWLKVWNPFATVLGVALLVLLTARTVADPGVSWCRWPATALTASFVVQTHVGTALVALACLAVATVAVGRWARTTGERLLRSPPRLLAAGVPLVLVWLPPLVQQLAPRPGERTNLGALLGYFLGGSAHGEPVADRLALAGRMLATFPAGRDLGPLTPPVDLGRAGTLGALLLPLPVALLVAWSGRRLEDRYLRALGLALGVASVAALVSAALLTGPLLNYVLIWLTVLPALLLFGVLACGAELVARRRRVRPAPRTLRTAAAAGMAAVLAVVVVLAVLAGLAAVTLFGPDERGRLDTTAVDRSAAPVLDRLAATPGCTTGPVLVDIRTDVLWPLAAGLALRLERAGHAVRVAGHWPLLFGAQDRATGGEACAVTLADPATARGTPVVTVDSNWGRAAIGVETR